MGITSIARSLVAAATVIFMSGAGAQQPPPSRVTILSDAFGQPSLLKRGWGYSALVEYGGKRILFDTGGSGDDLAFNASARGIDLTQLDFVVVTHRHGDHTSGLHQVLTVNPTVRIYTPSEPGFFDTPTPPGLATAIKRRVDSAPDDMHYYGGNYPARLAAGSAWPRARFTQVTAPTEVAPGVWLFSTQSDRPGTREMNEVSMAIATPLGLVLIVGCSHPGIEKILEVASKIDSRVYTIFGGLHLVDQTDDEVRRVVAGFLDTWKVARIAAGHCSGEFAFSELSRLFGPRFDQAGVGAVIALPR